MMKATKILAAVLLLTMLICCFTACGWQRATDDTTDALTDSVDITSSGTDAPETDAPETDAPETDAPETDAPETDAPETDAPVTDAPETDAPVTEPQTKTELLSPSADKYVQVNKTNNTGDETELIVKKDNIGGGTREIYLLFDTSEVQLSSAESAVLRLYITWNKLDSEIASTRDINLYAGPADWEEDSFTWSDKPESGEKIADIDISATKEKTYLEVNVTDYVNANLGKKICFILKNDGTDHSAGQVKITSSNAGSNGPELVIDGVEGTPPNTPNEEPEDTAPKYWFDEYYDDFWIEEPSEPAVDPTPTGTEIKTLDAIADTYIKIDTQLDEGNATDLFLKKDGGATRDVYVMFDTTGIQLSSATKATLKLYVFWNKREIEIASTRDINLYAGPTEWTESSFSWDNRPAAGDKIADVDVSETREKTYLEIDVTDYVSAHLGEKICFIIKNEGTDHESGQVRMNSREATGNQPKLVIEGVPSAQPSVPPVTPPAGEPADPEAYTAAADTYIQINKSVDAGTEAELVLKKDDAGGGTRDVYVTFDTTASEITTVTSAKLKFYITWNKKETAIASSRDINLYAGPTEWTESSFSWAEKPAKGDKIADVDVSAANENAYFEIDVTDYVNAHIGEKICFALVNEGTDHSGGQVKMHSREGTNAPALAIEGTKQAITAS